MTGVALTHRSSSARCLQRSTVEAFAAASLRTFLRGLSCLLFVLSSLAASGAEQTQSLFNGKNLDGWDGDPAFWSVRDGAITGQTTDENPTKGNTFLIWRGGEVGNFKLTVEYKLSNHNSGIQYRSRELPDQKWVMTGYQADIEGTDKFSGILYEEKARGILALRGQKTVVGDNGKPKVVEQIGDKAELQSHIKQGDWNTYEVTAEGFTFTHKINGVVMSVCTDEDPDARHATGKLALQLHAGPAMQVQFRNLQLTDLGQAASADAKMSAAKPGKKAGKGEAKKIVFVAGKASHGYGAHEHKAGCMLLAKQLEKSDLPVKTQVVTNGWPSDESVFEDADAIVIYADGGARHPANEHLDTLRKLSERGVGIVCLHYGVEVPKGEPGEAFLDAIGGYFETDWSVNPHWTAEFEALPNHPIANGVKPFSINDEWYYHMRFRDGMQNVTPILSDLPPSETLSRKDGPHSGNPAVRKAVAAGQPQHTAWAYVGSSGHRGFGFTGGHFHWNWGNDQFRKLVLNAIAWSAGLEVPEQGINSGKVTVADLQQNQDEPQPADFNPMRIQAELDQWNK